MRCKEVRSWTFQGLVSAFVDLSIAFLLLCASSLVYSTTKILGLFGSSLPCPCDGLFSRKNKCFQETLVNFPLEKISSVQTSVRNRTPFDTILPCKEANVGVGKKRKEEGERRHVDLEREVSTSTPLMMDSWAEKNASGFDLLNSQSMKKGSFRIKSKRLSFHRSPPTYGLKKHRQSSLGHKNQEYLNHVEDNDTLLVNSKEGEEEAFEEVSLRKSVSLSSVKCEADDHNKQPERTFSWAGEGTCSSPVDLTYKPIEILERVIGEERAARAALAIELEKERNAAASAADEALGMILRLQEEKACIEMEARQYQRMIEEKSAFDAEEMSLLKEILLRREKEKHFLEKEVDTYRQLFLENEQTLPNTPDSKPVQIKGSQTPHQRIGPLDDMETVDVSSGFEIFANHMDNRFLEVTHETVLPVDYGNEKEDKVDQDQIRSDGVVIDVEPKETEEGNCFQEPISRSSNISASKNLSEDPDDIDCRVHDIHVVTDEDFPSDHFGPDLKLDRSQSVSDTSYLLPMACPQGQRNMSTNMRRNSMSAFDYERLKVESEVGLLRGRLRAVQKGRENLSFSSKEHSKSQVHRRGDKTSRFWEARRSGTLDSSSSPSSSTTMVKAMSMTLDLHSA